MFKTLKTEKEVSGFDNDIIYIVKGDSFALKNQLKEMGFRFRRDFGWYAGSFCEKPEVMPSTLSLIEVKWEEVGNEDGSFKNEDVIKKVIESKIYDEDPSQWVGAVGDRVEVDVVVESKREFEGQYGSQLCYTFRDESRNCYVWFTSVGTKTSFEQDETYTIRGTLKKLDEYRNCKQNVLSRVTKRG